ncbi:MAG: single-stranded-DNA-specific exonuclease RecJ [Chloroflexi bacterium]|nr:single-stranded-DNA-specific exonuclease RecJ [Chloroflexota bacterium]
MSLTWLEPSPIAPPDELIAAAGHPLVAAALWRRGITTPDAARAFLDPDAYAPADPFDLPDMTQAVARIRRAIADREQIAVWGDFDVDGQTATALLVEGLTALRAQVAWHIPDRLSEGHGVHLPALSGLIDRGARVLVTCDTGIDAYSAIDYAKERGVDTIVTDHHQLPETLPNAAAIIHPLRLSDDHPMRTLPGVGAAFQLIRALARSMEADPALIDRLVDLVALGIVADVALQTGDTRYWLQRGLRQMRATLRPGLAALAETAALGTSGLNEGHIGFVLAPRLNAAGRLDDAAVGVELLLADNVDAARTIALRLESLNAQRRLLCDQIEGAAEAQIAADSSMRSADILVLHGPEWHAGVVGIVANRLVERYNVPVILLASPPGEEARGSARSVAGVNITTVLAANAHLLTGYGGHTMAAGLRLKPENIGRLRRALGRTVHSMRGEVTPGTLTVDIETQIPAVALDLVAALEQLAPFGPGNPPVVLAIRDLRLRDARTVGRDGAHRALTVENATGDSLKVMWWDSAALPLPDDGFDLACTVRASDYKGVRRVEVEYVDSQSGRVTSSAVRIEVVDHRRDPDPEGALLALDGAQVFREGGDPAAGVNRLELQPGETLALWTTPPDRAVLRAILDVAQPRAVHVFAIDPAFPDADSFLRRLLGLAKYALQNKDGVTDWEALASAMAATERCVALGLAVLEATGALRLSNNSTYVVRLEPGTGDVALNAGKIRAKLESALAECRAFRSHLHQTSSLDALFRR